MQLPLANTTRPGHGACHARVRILIQLGGFIPIKAKWLGIAVAILGIAGWIQISAQQRTTDRPPLDYVYFKIPEPQHQRITPDGKIQLWRVSTGLLKGVKIWGVDSEGRIFIAQKTISGGTTFLTALQEDFNEDVSPWSFFLPIGREYTIDIDHPNELGQLQERIKLTQTDNGVVQQIRLFRKRNGEVLLPRPIRLSPAEQAFLGIVLISFAVFGVTLIRYSWRA
jgi:hypothetical protein